MKKDFKNMSKAELVAKRDELKKKYMPVQIRTMRRQIACLNTLIHQQNAAESEK